MEKKTLHFGCLCAAACEAIFGCSFLFTKLATAEVSALTLLSWRFNVAFLALTILIALRVVHVDYRHKPIYLLLLIALMQPVVYFTCETTGIALTTTTESGTIIASIPVVTVFCSTLLLHEPPTKRQTVGMVTAMAGVFLTIFTQQSSVTLNAVGYALLFGAVLAHSLYTVLVSRAGAFTAVELTLIHISSCRRSDTKSAAGLYGFGPCPF